LRIQNRLCIRKRVRKGEKKVMGAFTLRGIMLGSPSPNNITISILSFRNHSKESSGVGQMSSWFITLQ